MERQKKPVAAGISVGSSSILVIFVVLALTAFAALSMTTAGSDLRLTQRVARSTQEYYAADAKAVELAAQLKEAYINSRLEQFPDSAKKLGWIVDGMFVSRSIPMSGEQTLEITADYSKKPLIFTRWQVVNSADWQEQDSFSLWDGETGNTGAMPNLPGFNQSEAATIGIIGGADGPTAIYVAGKD